MIKHNKKNTLCKVYFFHQFSCWILACPTWQLWWNSLEILQFLTIVLTVFQQAGNLHLLRYKQNHNKQHFLPSSPFDHAPERKDCGESFLWFMIPVHRCLCPLLQYLSNLWCLQLNSILHFFSSKMMHRESWLVAVRIWLWMDLSLSLSSWITCSERPLFNVS